MPAPSPAWKSSLSCSCVPWSLVIERPGDRVEQRAAVRLQAPEPSVHEGVSDGVLQDVAVAAVELDAGVHGALVELAAAELQRGRLCSVEASRDSRAQRALGERAGRPQLGADGGEDVAGVLERGDRLPE